MGETKPSVGGARLRNELKRWTKANGVHPGCCGLGLCAAEPVPAIRHFQKAIEQPNSRFRLHSAGSCGSAANRLCPRCRGDRQPTPSGSSGVSPHQNGASPIRFQCSATLGVGDGFGVENSFFNCSMMVVLPAVRRSWLSLASSSSNFRRSSTYRFRN